MIGLFAVYTNWALFVRLLLSILLPGKSETRSGQDHEFANSMITSRLPLKQPTSDPTNKPQATKVPLTSEQVHANRVTAYEDLLDVIHFYFMPSFGCVHCRAEWFLFAGEYTPYLPRNHATMQKCLLRVRPLVREIHPSNNIERSTGIFGKQSLRKHHGKTHQRRKLRLVCGLAQRQSRLSEEGVR